MQCTGAVCPLTVGLIAVRMRAALTKQIDSEFCPLGDHSTTGLTDFECTSQATKLTCLSSFCHLVAATRTLPLVWSDNNTNQVEHTTKLICRVSANRD